MIAKLNFMKPLVVGGAVAAAIAVMPVAAAEAYAGGPTSAAPTHVVYKQDPGGGGCDPNGNCGSGGQFNGPGGVPENSGYPDQTYDSWVVTGVSAYSGNLWLGALRAAEETAHVLDDSEAEATYHAMFLKAQKTYIAALWTGHYFRYEASGSSRDGIQADQLAGQWYANMTGLGDLIPHSMQVATLRQIYSFNVLKFGGGVIGAANGMKPDGTVVNNEQAREVWVGTTSSLAALMLEGFLDAAEIADVVVDDADHAGNIKGRSRFVATISRTRFLSYSMPFVLGMPLTRGSRRTACSSARARPLKTASTRWCVSSE